MIFSFGGGKRRGLILSMSSCSSDDSPVDDPTKATSTPTPDVKAAVEDLTTRYWEAVVASEKTATPTGSSSRTLPSEHTSSASSPSSRLTRRSVSARVGQPVIADIEVTIKGDTADIRLCKNEDDWTAEQDGEPVPNDKKFGDDPWGAEASKVDDKWLITDVRLPPRGSKTCA